MSDLLDPLYPRAEHLSNLAQPVIFALGTAGITGGAMAAVALFTNRALHCGRKAG